MSVRLPVQRVEPTRLAVALALIYGVSRPRSQSALLMFPCDACRGRRALTVCPNCNGLGRIMVLG